MPNMTVTIRLSGGYILPHWGTHPGTGYIIVAIVGGAKLTERRLFSTGDGALRRGSEASRIIPAGVVNVHVQREGDDQYETRPSTWVAQNWSAKENEVDDGDRGAWKEIRSLEDELRRYAREEKRTYVSAPIRFTGFSVFAFINHGTLSADKSRAPLVGSNMTTGEVVERPGARVDFEVPEEENLMVTLATPQIRGGQMVMHEDVWLSVKGRGLIHAVEIDIDPLDPYAPLPVIGYEGTQQPPPDRR